MEASVRDAEKGRSSGGEELRIGWGKKRELGLSRWAEGRRGGMWISLFVNWCRGEDG